MIISKYFKKDPNEELTVGSVVYYDLTTQSVKKYNDSSNLNKVIGAIINANAVISMENNFRRDIHGNMVFKSGSTLNSKIQYENGIRKFVNYNGTMADIENIEIDRVEPDMSDKVPVALFGMIVLSSEYRTLPLPSSWMLLSQDYTIITKDYSNAIILETTETKDIVIDQLEQDVDRNSEITNYDLYLIR